MVDSIYHLRAFLTYDFTRSLLNDITLTQGRRHDLESGGTKLFRERSERKKFLSLSPPLFAEWGGQKYKSIITVLHSVVNNNNALQVN
jgi:hypothetical protein